MGLMAMGATFDIKKAFAKVKPAAVATFMKLIGLAAIFLPIAITLGFRKRRTGGDTGNVGISDNRKLFCYGEKYGHEGVLSSSVEMLTTLFSAFTLTGLLYILKSMNFI